MSNEPILTQETLIERVHSSFSKKAQAEIVPTDVQRVLSDLRLADPPVRPPCHLTIRLLEMHGTKTLGGDGEPTPIAYSQEFAPGVNVLLIEDNDVGKSSILKTIKFALTGDDGDYDADVKKWLSQIRLSFSLDNECYTIALSCDLDVDGDFGVLYADKVSDVSNAEHTSDNIVFRAADKSELQESLRRFFFDKIGLSRLAWALPAAKSNDEARDAGTTWLTYFQALQIPDGGDRYLLCDEKHAIGNQEGLIFSSFLGLHLAEQLNWLGVEGSKQQKLEKGTQQERNELQTRLNELQEKERDAKERLDKLRDSLRKRSRSFRDEKFQERIATLQDKVRGQLDRETRCSQEVVAIGESLSFLRSRETQIREMIALKLHFTGLDVRLCPNCDTEVTVEEIEREQESHHCRLCNKPAHDATPDEISVRQAEAEQIADQVAEEERRRNDLKKEGNALNEDIVRLRNEIELTEAGIRQKLDDALPTQDEVDQRDHLLQETGKLAAQIHTAKQRLTEFENAGAFDVSRRRILKKAREILQGEANRRNKELLERLSRLTKDVARQIGAESITDVTCSSLGTVKLTKHDERVRFTGIKNQGERMRVKLAFFLAMMRLGREPGFGRHPGLLLVDQPGSAEMVTEDFRALAKVLHSFDDTQEDQFQILCFTARPEFSEATRPERVYGPQSGKYAF